MQRWILAVMVSVFVVIGYTGCSNDGLVAVSGEITLDGTPLKSGVISFMPVGNAGVSASGLIQDGKYQLRISPVPMMVSITAERLPTDEEITKRKSNPMLVNSMTPVETMTVQYIPKEYNESSKLRIDAKTSLRDLDFALKSTP
ncbi:MAG: hypothetical protein ACRC46_01500 [Thermoguttaceae bacterium]